MGVVVVVVVLMAHIHKNVHHHLVTFMNQVARCPLTCPKYTGG